MLPSNRKAAKSVSNMSEDFIMIEGILFRKTHDKNDFKINLAILECMHLKILELFNDGIMACHLGVIRCYHIIR